MRHTHFCFQSKTITYPPNLWCFLRKRTLEERDFWNKWNGNKARNKKGNAHFPPLIFMQLTQPLQSLHFTKDWRYRFEVTQKALKSKSIKKGAPLSPNLC